MTKQMKNKIETSYRPKRVIGLHTAFMFAVVATAICLIPEYAFADDPNAFDKMLTKVNGWVGGSFGKLVTFSSLVMAGIMGVVGFPTRYIAGAVGTGLLLASAKAIVELIFITQ